MCSSVFWFMFCVGFSEEVCMGVVFCRLLSCLKTSTCSTYCCCIPCIHVYFVYFGCLYYCYIYLLQNFFFFFNIFIYLFLAALVPCSLQCVGLSLQWPPSLRSTGCRHVGFSSCGMRGSAAAAHGLYSTGSVVVVHRQHVGSSPTRAQTHVPCIGRWILNHCATREVPKIS